MYDIDQQQVICPEFSLDVTWIYSWEALDPIFVA